MGGSGSTHCRSTPGELGYALSYTLKSRGNDTMIRIEAEKRHVSYGGSER